jgi:hypothetical protein
VRDDDVGAVAAEGGGERRVGKVVHLFRLQYGALVKSSYLVYRLIALLVLIKRWFAMFDKIQINR